MPEYWMQIENRPWDICPHNIDRMTGQTIQQVDQNHPAPVSVTLTSINGGASRKVQMFKPIRDASGNIMDALILRRYKAPVKADKSDAWTVPDDRKINPWDLNEPNPTETGTMGTVPGATLEASIGDSIVVHFRNKDHRLTTTGQPMAIEHRCHSLHPHGVVFAPTSDGAYPLSPADPAQPLGTEAALWAMVPQWGGSQFKQSDRVPPDATFTYTWNTFGWPTTAGVWLYHDHSICDDDNVNLGAIGMIVIHNPADKEQEVDTRLAADPTQPDPTLMPGGSPNGSPLFSLLFPFPEPVPILPHQVADLRPAANVAAGAAPAATHVLRVADNAQLHVDAALHPIQVSFLRYRTPPAKAQIFQLFHSLYDGSTCINGRQYLGNTPTVISGPSTLMRFGVVAMGSEFHTFHIHGHRWTLPGPTGTNLTQIMQSAQIGAVSQFEDTRTFGPANSFVFTINESAPLAPGSFMRAGGPGPTDAVGEWHMHCHVLMHMMSGMMGSLLIVNGGEVFTALPTGVPCPPMDTAAPPGTHTVDVVDFSYNPQTINISAGDTVHWVWQADDHSVTSDVSGQFGSGVNNTGHTFDHMFMSAGTFNYHCSVHGAGMHGMVVVT
jgi:plastocyanin